MATELAADTFLKLLERSGIIPNDQFSLLAKEYEEPTAGTPSSRKIAEELVDRGVLTRWQADQLLEGKYKGFILGPYRVLGLLGHGGMGMVFLAEHQMMRRRCAVKVLPLKDLQNQPSLLERFYIEAQAVAALDHPNIVRAYDVNKAMQDGREIHYLVMEYIDGLDLQRYVSQHGVVDYRQAADWIRQAAEGLDHAHREGLVHRDVKPANLLVDRNGVVKLLDLGLARFFDDRERASLSKEHGETVLGTADYLAPEQAVDSGNVDGRADIYSLGHTFYFLLVGRPPFPTGSVAQRLMAHQTKYPEPIQKDRPDVPPQLVAIINKMTAKKPKERFQTARELADVLKDWLAKATYDSGFMMRFTSQGRGVGSGSGVIREPGEGSSAGEEVELDLAPVEDVPPPTPSSITRASTAATAGETAPAEPAPEPKPEPVIVEITDELPDLTPPKTDDLGSLMAAEALPPAAPLPAAAPQAPAGSPSAKPIKRAPAAPVRKKSAEEEETIFQSPVFWAAAGAAVVAIAIIAALAIHFSSKGPGPEPSAPPAGAQPPVAPPPDAVAPPPPVETEPAEPPSTTGAEAAASPAEPPIDATPPERSSAKADKPPPQRAPAEPAVPPKPAPGGSQPAPWTAAAPPVAPPQPVDPRQLLAGVKRVSFRLKPPGETKLHKLVQEESIDAARRAGIEPQSGAPNTLHLELLFGKADSRNLVRIALSGRLEGTGSNGKKVTLWEHETEVATTALHLLQRHEPAGASTAVKRFFAQFVKDVEAARAEFTPRGGVKQ